MISRRKFLGASGAALAGLAGAGIPSARASSVAVPRGPLDRIKITDVKTAAIDIGYTTHLVKVTTDSELSGIGEAYNDGHLKVSGKPGLGIELNEDVCKSHLADNRGFFA